MSRDQLLLIDEAATSIEAETFYGQNSLPAWTYGQLARRLIADRRARERAFGNGLFADPAWDIMLDLFAAHEEGRAISISSLCIAASVPPTTALRWITTLEKKGMLERKPDQKDQRRIYISLTAHVQATVRDYLKDLARRWGVAIIES